MAGSYADVPSRRMAWDDDGTVAHYSRANARVLTEMSAAQRTELNDEDNTLSGLPGGIGGNQDGYFGWIFPELREFDGSFIAYNAATDHGTRTLQTSGDTTNGIDGTWTTRDADYAQSGLTYPDTYRTAIQSFAVSNVRGVRHTITLNGGGTSNARTYHLYGEISPGETPDRLLWFDNDTDLEFSKPQDYGDAPRGSAEDHVVYLKNNSASLSANTVQITAEDLYLGSGAWYTFDDGTGFAATKQLASAIGSAANSPDVTIRCIRPDAATLGLHSARAYANVGSWT